MIPSCATQQATSRHYKTAIDDVKTLAAIHWRAAVKVGKLLLFPFTARFGSCRFREHTTLPSNHKLYHITIAIYCTK